MRRAFIAVLIAVRVSGQGPAPSGKAAAPVDLTGNWVAFVTEDWRFRMITPRKGDFQGVPMNDQARKIANAWDPAADAASGNQCKAYGAPAIMRAASRFRIAWQDDNALRIESDYGTQTRMFRFGATGPPGERTWQGHSTAQWQRPSTLKVSTANLRAGYLRKNGVPYGENAVLTEYFELAPLPGGGQALLVTAMVEDPQYLQLPFIVTSQLKKEADGSKWDPTPCTAQ